MHRIIHLNCKELIIMMIKPSTCLRNDYNDIANFCKTENQPVFLTKNGEGDLVVMSMEAYSCRMDYNQATDFYLPFEASAQADVISDLSDLVVSYLGGDSFGKAVSTFKIAIGNL